VLQVPNAHNDNASRSSLVPSQSGLKAFARSHPLHSILLQLPSSHSILGDPHVSRFDPIPHIIHSALGHLPIHAYTSAASTFDPFLAIDDASHAIVQSARMLELAAAQDYLIPLAFVAEINVVGIEGNLQGGAAARVAEQVISLVRSQSPSAEIRAVGDDGGEVDDDDDAHEVLFSVRNERNVNAAWSRKTTARAIGFKAGISLQSTLRGYIATLLRLQEHHLSPKISVACSSPPSVPVLEEGLVALSGSKVQLLTIIEGSYYTLACTGSLEGDYARPIAIVPAVPYKEGVQGVTVVLERGFENKVDVQLHCPAGNSTSIETIIWTDSPAGGTFAESTTPRIRPIAEWFTIDFVHRDSRAFTLTLPPTEGVEEGDEERRRMTLRDGMLLFQPASADELTLLWRINPICAVERRSDVWDFLKEDRQ
jgi:hypothetical protein